MNPIVHKKYALQFPNVETSKRRIEGKQHKQNSFRTPQWWLCLLFIFVLVQLAAVVTASAEENRDKLRSSSRSLRVLRFESNDSIVSSAEDGDFNASGSLIPSLDPSIFPSDGPSQEPSNSSLVPSLAPSLYPTQTPTNRTGAPTFTPSPVPTLTQKDDSDPRVLTNAPGGPTIGWGDDDFFSAPVDVLTSPPSPSRTPPPTPSPTPVPTPPPTVHPTPSPTRDIIFNQEPSASLTSPPSQTPRPPTETPTKTPTRTPTPAPTKAPTKRPTKAPTDSPTEFPTESPTGRPSKAPSRRPTLAPVTGTPTRTPTRHPSLSPTSSPTRVQTGGPTRYPTLSPTLVASTEPSAFPTPLPTTPDPTPSGTLEPTIPPSSLPSIAPSASQAPSTASPQSAFPSVGPTQAPSPSPTLATQSGIVNVAMTLFPFSSGAVLQGQAAIAWERETESHLGTYLLGSVEPAMFNLEVSANIVNQYFVSGLQLESNRALQDGSEPVESALVVKFDVEITFRSVGQSHDLDALVFAAWDETTSRETYVTNLQGRSSTFDEVEDVLLDVDGYEPPPEDDDDFVAGNDDSPEEKSNVAVIAGAAVGGAALLLLVVFMLLRRSGEKSLDGGEHGHSNTAAETAAVNKITTEILVEPQDDVSTLGDPMFAPGGMLFGALEKDEATASAGDDYEYARQYRLQSGHAHSISDRTPDRSRLLSEEYTKTSSANSTTMSKLGRMGDSLFADDASFEQQFAEPEELFDVVAPAGKLGMVIDTPNGGMPVVHAIKDTSVLADRVRVGDRLLSVDGEDCTAMTAMQVSKLISLKSEKPARVLVFARSRAAPAEN